MYERPYIAADGSTVWIRDNTLTRVRTCRRKRLPNQEAALRWDTDQEHLSGLAVCSSVWACPVCSAKIRHARTEESRQIFDAHLAAGGQIAFVTLTASHKKSDALTDLLDAVVGTWREVIAGRNWSDLSRSHGIVMASPTSKTGVVRRFGLVRSLENKHSANGHHPHLHVAILYHGDQHARDEIRRHITHQWRKNMAQRGYKVGARIGVIWKDITPDTSAALAGYLCKVQDGTDGLALEVTRDDLKQAKARSGRGMFDVLAGAVIDGDLQDSAVWLEYERATKGRQCITFSRGLREHFGIAVKKDQELAEEQVGGENTYVLDDTERAYTLKSTDRVTDLYHAVRAGGYAGVLDYFLAALGHASGGGGIQARYGLDAPPTRPVALRPIKGRLGRLGLSSG